MPGKRRTGCSSALSRISRWMSSGKSGIRSQGDRTTDAGGLWVATMVGRRGDSERVALRPG